jgi:NAD(P)-dependent dehydrogenase (short-subunit alcohol dehydrogenase family)
MNRVNDQQIVLITGALGRLGKTFSKFIVNSDAHVFLVDQDEEKGRQLVDELGIQQADFLAVDITTISGIQNAIQSCIARFGRVDAVVHAAYPRSAGWGATLENLQAQHLFEDLSKQLGGAILLSQQVIPQFQRQGGGHLIHISSIQGIAAPKFEHYEGTDMNSPIEYSAIKSGVIAVTKWLAKRYRQQNIRVNCISLGGILDQQPEPFLARYKSSCNSKGMLNAEDVAGALLYLLSNQSQFVTGQNLIVDDGWSL